jgi:hypothetical protein
MIEDAGLMSTKDFLGLGIADVTPVTSEKDPAVPADQFIDFRGHLLVRKAGILCFVKSK